MVDSEGLSHSYTEDGASLAVGRGVMQADPTPQVIGALVSAVLGSGLGYFFARLQTKRKIVEYSVNSMRLIRFKRTENRPISISVMASALTGKDSDGLMQIPINDAYGFEILLKNIGNDVAERLNIEFHLDSEARIVEYEIQPESSPGYEVTVNKDLDRLNVIHAYIPFLSERERVLIRLISTGNRDRLCDVTVRSPGVNYRPERAIWNRIRPMLVPLAVLVAVSVIMILSVVMPKDTMLAVAPYIGATVQTRERTYLDFPLWLNTIIIIGLAIATISYVFVIVRASKEMRRIATADWDRGIGSNAKRKEERT
jgi:hypothetical protein